MISSTFEFFSESLRSDLDNILATEIVAIVGHSHRYLSLMAHLLDLYPEDLQ